MPAFDRELVADALRQAGTIAGAARLLGYERRRLSEFVNADAELATAHKAPKPDRASVTIEGDRAEITGPAGGGTPDEVAALIRENGLDPDEWVIVSTTLNKWDGPTKGGGKQTLRQVKVTLRRKAELFFRVAVVHAPELVKPRASARISVDEPDIILIEGDHQAPYFDPRLDALTTRLTHDLQPAEHVFLGDTGDYPTVSRHADHPAAMASVRECDAAVYGILRRRSEASPLSVRKKLEGNHDWRIAAELLARAERVFDRVPVGEDEPVWSTRRVLHLERLGIELVTDPRGWQHGEVELVPGMNGLVVRHGWLTGANNAEKSLDKRGRSIIFGHVHTRQHVFKWDPSAGVERQGVSIGAQCLVRNERFPHFAVCDNWLQGPATVARWRDGRFQIEHARYSDGVLTWRDRRWEA